MAAAIRLEYGAQTHPGMRRTVNEDAFLAADPVYVVADGMGGHEAGDRASAAAVAAFDTLVGRNDLTYLEIDEALQKARLAVLEVAATTQRGGGCTLTGVVRIMHTGVPQWHVLNIGDSRVYEYLDGELRQITRDHSLRHELLAQGSPQANLTPRNVITRALGSEDSRHDAWLIPLQVGSRLLVCSDGLTTELQDIEIAEALSTSQEPDVLVSQLISLACERGGRDNITAIIVDTLALDLAPVAPPETNDFLDLGDDTEDNTAEQDHTVRVAPADRFRAEEQR
ncbi:PP2C family protein-serine/threonine phosphatase [Leucobacter sp. 1207-22]|uniref:PP2C family protein-serine/threonine phosphatase n=1 Tax=Leucobacter sp. 1207-22 TaxID=2604456 RepID=UPI004064AE67